MTDEYLKPIADELLRIEEAATHSAQTQFSSGKFWRSVHLALGVSTAAVAAVAGATGLADVAGATTVALLALIAAALSAVMTTLNASERAAKSHKAANDYLSLQNDARVAGRVDLPTLDPTSARAELAALRARQDEVNMSAPVAAFLAYLFGRRNINKGRTEYEVDKP